MTLDNVLDLLKRRPFDPFLIITSSGERYQVRHPEMAWPIRNGLYVGLGGKAGLPDRAAFISLLHICAVETPPHANGNKKRR